LQGDVAVPDPRRPAPVFVEAFGLAQWLYEHFQAEAHPLGGQLCRCAQGLLEALALALKQRRREWHMDHADELLIRLRVQLRMAEALGLLDQQQLYHALDRADAIGRQLGGWLRSERGEDG
jgi:hypothetical protein